MKEATGELNMTVVTVIAIAAIGVLFYTVVWPIIERNIQNSTNCANAICQPCSGGTASCQYYDESNKLTPITCACEDSQ